MSCKIACSIVLYKNDKILINSAIKSFLNTNLNVHLYLIDNSPTDELRDITIDTRVEYIYNPKNPGFGAAHNIAINKGISNSKYHLVLNPDVFFELGVIEKIANYMDVNNDVGVIMPKILYPNGRIQYLAKLLPSPVDFIFRRLVPLSFIKRKIDYKFELRKSGYNQIIEAPFLSGCFLFFRTEVLKRIGGFDEQIFMYTEDIDICRRVIQANYKSIFYPEVRIYHDHTRKSIFDLQTLKIFLKSSAYYFSKWGWFWDMERKQINRRTLNLIN